jgi:hypothetical protein
MEHQINCRIDTSDNKLSTIIDLAMYYKPCQDVEDFYNLATIVNYYTQHKYLEMMALITKIVERYIECFDKSQESRDIILNKFLRILAGEEQ